MVQIGVVVKKSGHDEHEHGPGAHNGGGPGSIDNRLNWLRAGDRLRGTLPRLQAVRLTPSAHPVPADPSTIGDHHD
jgi:hypothetical protein